MTSYLDDAGIDRLGDLLESRAVPHKGFNLEALDGYLSALAVGPLAIDRATWEPAVWGTPPRFDADERKEIDALLEAHWAMASQRVRHGDDDLPDHLAPLLWLPEEPDQEDDDDLDVGRDWAFGFFRGVEHAEAGWEAWLDDNDWMDEIFALLERLGTGEVPNEDPAAEPTELTYAERLEIIASLPGMLADLHHHRIEALTPREPIRREATPERNDPCPCGSGKKYKKCCGLQ